MKCSLKVVLVTNMVAPYRISFYNALSNLCDLTVLTDVEAEFNRSWCIDKIQFMFNNVVMHSRSIVLPRVRKDLDYKEHRQMHFSEKLWSYLRELRPDVVISNELGLRSFWCMLYSKVFQCPWILATEATNHTEGWVRFYKRAFRKLLISQADVFWSNGAETNRFLLDRGAAFECIMPGMTGIDTIEFRRLCETVSVSRDANRDLYGLNGVVFLYVGRIESGKGMSMLMDSIIRRQSELSGRASFCFVGSGSMLDEVKEQASHIHGINFHFEGFVQPDELPRFFALGDVFIMPTLDDNWPLVNLESLAAGLPQLYSIYNGGMLDMNAIAGIGSAIDPKNIEFFSQRLVDCVNFPVDRINSKEAIELLDYYSPDQQARRAALSFKNVLYKANSLS